LTGEAKKVGQPVCRLAGPCESESEKDSHFDFTVVSGYLECLILVAVLVVLGVAEALLESL
jgi:hypothetical protein